MFRRHFVLIFLLISLGLSGQKIQPGIYFGISASEVDGDANSGFNKLGINAAVFMNRHIDLSIYWQMELRYGARGARVLPNEYDPYSFRSNYHYLQLPLSVFYLNEPSGVTVTIGLAPEILAGVSYRENELPLPEDSYPENHFFGLSVFAGIGYRPREDMEIQLRYTNSAYPFRDVEEWNHPRYRGYFHNVISLSFMYSLKKKNQATESEATETVQ